MIPNPFTFGNPIRDPNRFIGRQSDIRQVVNRLRSSAHESTSIVGERRMGKTSLLKHLESKDVAADLGLPPEEFCMVYMDFQGLTDITPQRFWQRVLQKTKRAICNPSLTTEISDVLSLQQFDIFDLEDLFTIIADENITVVLLLDEFEYVTQNPNFGSDFFGGLRALAIHHNLPLVTSTRRELIDLCHSEELKGSPFFNIFANIVLRPFEPEEVNDLVSNYLIDSEIQFSETEIDLLWSLGGGYPFFTQIAAHYAFDAKMGGTTGDELFDQVTQAFEQQANAHYQYMWSRTSESEKITLLAVMTLNKTNHKHKTGVTLEKLANLHSRAHMDVPELTKRGMLVEEQTNRTYRILSPSLERWISGEILAMPGEESSEIAVNTWLAGLKGQELVSGHLLRLFKEEYWPVLVGIPEEISQRLVLKEDVKNKKVPINTSSIGESVFICYSRKDKVFVDKLVADMNSQGIATWRDVDNIAGASQSNLQGWRAAIEKALDECAAMLIILSPGAVDSHEVQAEWNHFASYNRPIYPIIASQCSVPFYLKIYQIWDMSSDYSTKISQLSDVLKSAIRPSGNNQH